MENKDLGKSSLGMQPNMAAMLSYVFGFITGIIFFAVEKENKFVKFHAMQSMVVFGGLFVINLVLSLLIPPLAIFISPIIGIASVVLWIILMIKSYQGDYFKLPFAGDIAEKNSNIKA
ncbi:MAG: DUF4870 domain-containing protein [Candidatus Omnitrophica bacterium]|nr:DUF4870 domain-containing protein [Candidatus Omnitrophota bacterium]MBD3269018.1 DUF4870 domain-containing protein [Candidatus Omnitrophota bacterium]